MGNEQQQKSYLSFKLGKETFASNVSKVLNILEMPAITEVPQAPDFMQGVMNLRGTVLPVIDTRIKFGMSPIEVTANTCVLVLEISIGSGSIKIGALVDAVDEVLKIQENDIKPTPTIGSKYSNHFIQGLYHKNEGFIMILNTDRVFTDIELSTLQDQIEMTA